MSQSCIARPKLEKRNELMNNSLDVKMTVNEQTWLSASSCFGDT